MTAGHNQVLRVGDRVRFEDDEWSVTGLDGTRVRLSGDTGRTRLLLAGHLLASPGFRLLGADPAARYLDPVGLLDALPPSVVQRARSWERHVVEVETGLPPDAPPGTPAHASFDPSTRTLAQRDAAKAAELSLAGEPVSAATVKRMRLRYRAGGIWALVDHRGTRPVGQHGRVDPRVATVLAAAMQAETLESTGTRSRLRRRVERQIAVEYGDHEVRMPSRATFYRLCAAMDTGRHTFGQATTPRTQANRPERPFTQTLAQRPGELVQIDTSPLDVIALLDDGVPGRVELTIVLDVATRSICAAVLRPRGTKAVDAALLLARMLVPEPMRPGWPEALHMARSSIPHGRLLALDERLEHAAARPVVVPETVVTDRGSVFLSQTFVSACARLGISIQTARPRTPTDKGIVERSFRSINTLFSQHVAGYLGADVTRRGTPDTTQARWSVPQLQELLDEWIVAGWQPRPHEGLRLAASGLRPLSPNEMFAAGIAAAGYLRLPLTGDDYLELLPVCWRTIGDHGIQIGHRHYDSPQLNPCRHTTSGVAGKNRRWEIHYDPYNLSQVFVRDMRTKRWITATWTHLPMVAAPFADFTWRAARQIVAGQGGDTSQQSEVAHALHDLLTRAAGPSAPDAHARRVRARTAAAPPAPRPDLPDARSDDAPTDDDAPIATIIPLRAFEAGDERRYR
ncbi:Mu transposase C-terminal domain-containing protein [Couchioplanes caeruleus]|uniref:Integrase n=2 Tax=Couchioplanes caeruleus TaxID=56438 RepID=A0A1K0GVK3_9ACTN|nr:Mu transposase C-terminal domain-containing protein [Couchioplanes caeruleus]OJF15420.1 integrase [Couchioplanes caeruleus subsp. caeruleus]ROP33466.1 Mu transposase-like protein [Couchioplanes caeruleus]